MSVPQTLQIQPANAAGPLKPGHKRFNTLLRQIEDARAVFAAWQEAIPAYRASFQQSIFPLLQELHTVSREWVLALDSGSRRGWKRADHDTAAEVIAEMAGQLLGRQADDPELKTVFARNADQDFEDAKRESVDLFKDLAEEITGVDLGDEDFASEDELTEKLDEKLRQRAEAEAAREARQATRRKSKAQQRREEEAQHVTQSVREVYRKLASALHPDRETDPKERAAKTELMAQVNDAHARGDLLTLLQLQLRIEQIDAEHLAKADERRLKHYNKVLSEQLQELRDEIEMIEDEFRIDFDLDLFEPVHPKSIGKLLRGSEAHLREELAIRRRETKMFADAAATRSWLKRQRERLRYDGFDMPF